MAAQYSCSCCFELSLGPAVAISLCLINLQPPLHLLFRHFYFTTFNPLDPSKPVPFSDNDQKIQESKSKYWWTVTWLSCRVSHKYKCPVKSGQWKPSIMLILTELTLSADPSVPGATATGTEYFYCLYSNSKIELLLKLFHYTRFVFDHELGYFQIHFLLLLLHSQAYFGIFPKQNFISVWKHVTNSEKWMNVFLFLTQQAFSIC